MRKYLGISFLLLIWVSPFRVNAAAMILDGGTYFDDSICTVGSYGSYFNLTSNSMMVCVNGTATALGTGGAGVPSGLITFVLSGTCPTGWSEVAALDGKAIYGTLAAHADVGGAIGNATVTPTTSSISLTAAAQTIAWPAGVPTNAGGAFSEGAISWPAGVPSLSGSTASEASHTHAITQSAFTTTKFTTSGSGTAAFTGGGLVTTPSGAGSSHLHGVGTLAAAWPAGVPTIAAGSFTQPTVSWPAGVPTNGTSAVSGTISMNALTPQFSGIKAIFCSKN